MENFEDQFEEDHFRRLWWAQDGAPAHTALQVRELLNEMFQNCVIAIHHQTEWPARSPDLSACDFFLWGYLKNKVFTSPPATIAILRQRIEEEFERLRANPEVVRRAVRSTEKGIALCIDRGLRHVEGNS